MMRAEVPRRRISLLKRLIGRNIVPLGTLASGG
jgi:hypothetical protein